MSYIADQHSIADKLPWKAILKTDRQTDRQTYSQTEIHTQRVKYRQIYRRTKRQTDRQTDRKTDRQKKSFKLACSPATLVCENINFLQAVLERLELILRPPEQGDI